MNNKFTATAAVVMIVMAFFFIHTRVKPLDHQTPIHLRAATFSELPSWGTTNTLASFHAFQVSCRVFLKQAPGQSVGSGVIDLKAEHWYPACHAALNQTVDTNKKATSFFESWFNPVEFYENQPVMGLFTGYYLPALSGSTHQTKKNKTPVYGVPRDLVTARLTDFNQTYPKRMIAGRVHHGQLIPYYTRAQIDQGAIDGIAPVVAWVSSPIDRLILEIEGSGLVQLSNGERLFLGYAGQNGAPYTAIGRVLIEQGVMTRDNASMQRIRAYLDANPKQIKPVLNRNESFVFFKPLKQSGALGSQGTVLTDGYSLAVDRDWVPMGTPIWLSTTRPDKQTNATHPFKRLMIAQDTGGAIRGPVRGDIFWGAGERATSIAGKMKDQGRYWLLLPKTFSF